MTAIRGTPEHTVTKPSEHDVQKDSNESTASDRRLLSDASHLRDYEKLGLLGCGGAAVVYLVRHRVNRRLYALKVQQASARMSRQRTQVQEHVEEHNKDDGLHSRDYADTGGGSSQGTRTSSRQTRRAFKELQVLQTLRHPFVARLHDAFQDGANLCLVLEFYEGGTLADVQTFCGGRFLEQEAKFYTAELVLALEYVHTMGIVYRDLKPQNVLVHRDGHIRLADFGVAQRGDLVTGIDDANTDVDADADVDARGGDRTRAQSHHYTNVTDDRVRLRSCSFVGTTEYMSPEMILQRPQSTDVDWWALGCVLYELIFGVAPFRAPERADSSNQCDPAAQFKAILQCRIVFPATPSVSDACKDLLRSLLVREPQDRLGHRFGAAEIKQHRFFEGVQWALLGHCEPPVVLTHSVAGSDPRASCVKWLHLSRLESDAWEALTVTEQTLLGAFASSDWPWTHSQGCITSADKTSQQQQRQQLDAASIESPRTLSTASNCEDTCDEELDRMILESPTSPSLSSSSLLYCSCCTSSTDCHPHSESLYQRNERFALRERRASSFVDAVLRRREGSFRLRASTPATTVTTTSTPVERGGSGSDKSDTATTVVPARRVWACSQTKP